MEYVIIGNGGAGISALQAIRASNALAKITVISKEQYPSYSPCSLPNLIAGEIDQETIYRFDKEHYRYFNATFRKNTEALHIHPEKKMVSLSDGSSITYHKLLIAAGAKPIIPKIEGLHKKGVFIMGVLSSSLDIIEHIQKGVSHAVVIGGGFMGVETAVSLQKKGISTTIVEMLPHILTRMLDSDMADKVALQLKNNGIEIIVNDRINKINGTKKVTSVSLQEKTIKCDMVISAVGVSPNIDLVKDTQIKTNRGILVDTTMLTSISDIYAAGDIAEVHEQIQGKRGSFAIWPNAIEQGRIAGFNMARITRNYHGAELVNILNIFGLPIVSMGYTLKECGKCTVMSRITPDVCKKIILKNNRIIGLQFIGSIINTGLFYSMMKKGTNIEKYKTRLLDDTFIIEPESVNK